MGLLDDYLQFDPELFQPSGGLYGRLASLQPQLSFDQPAQGSPFPPVPAAASSSPPATSRGPAPLDGGGASGIAQAGSSWPRDDGQTLNMRVGDYWMPQFGRAEPAAPVAVPTFCDRLNAGLQSWAHTPLGNPFAAIANGMTGFNTGRRSDDWTGQPVPDDQGASMLGGVPSRSPAVYLRRRGLNNVR